MPSSRSQHNYIKVSIEFLSFSWVRFEFNSGMIGHYMFYLCQPHMTSRNLFFIFFSVSQGRHLNLHSKKASGDTHDRISLLFDVLFLGRWAESFCQLNSDQRKIKPWQFYWISRSDEHVCDEIEKIEFHHRKANTHGWNSEFSKLSMALARWRFLGCWASLIHRWRFCSSLVDADECYHFARRNRPLCNSFVRGSGRIPLATVELLRSFHN